MASKTARRMMPESYFTLVREWPLVHLQDDRSLRCAQQMIDRLLARDLDRGEQAYLDALTDLVEAYEDSSVSIPDASESDVLRELMRANGLSQAKLSQLVGIAQSTISAVVTGVRSLTKSQTLKLAQYFQVSPNAFMPEVRPADK